MRQGIFVVGLASILLFGELMHGAGRAAEVPGPEQDPCGFSKIRASIRPGNGGAPTEVTIGVRMTDLTEINDVDQTLTGEFLVRQRWTDPRLDGLEGCELPLADVWSPHLGFVNSGRMFPVLPQTVEIGSGGLVTYLQSFYGTLASYETLEDFPFDEHVFKIWLLSAKYSESAVKLMVDKEFTGRRDLLNISDWIIGSVTADSGRYFFHATDSTQSLFELRIPATRIQRFYIWKVILPLCLIVMMSWAVFWINPANFGPQIGLSATSMLTLIAFLFATTNMVPKLGYFTTFDLFLGSSLVLVFLAFIESLVATYLVSKEKLISAMRIDRISRALFPALFLLIIALVLSL